MDNTWFFANILQTGLKRVIPDCATGRILIQSSIDTGEPELHFLKLPDGIKDHDSVLLLDPQVSRPCLPSITTL